MAISNPTPPSTTYTETQPNPNLAFSDTLPRQNQPTFSLNPISNPSPPPSTTSPHPQPTNTIPNTTKAHNIPQPKTTQTLQHLTSPPPPSHAQPPNVPSQLKFRDWLNSTISNHNTFDNSPSSQSTSPTTPPHQDSPSLCSPGFN